MSTKVNYHNNSLAGNTPSEASWEEGGYVHYPQKVDGHVTREVPSDSFKDFFSQARFFWNSLSPVEKQDLVDTFIFHLGSVESEFVRQQNIEMWANVDHGMATKIAEAIGVHPPKESHVPVTGSSPAISQANTPHYAYTQKVGILIGDGFNCDEVRYVTDLFEQQGVFFDVVSETLNPAVASDGTKIKVNETFTTTYPVLYDSLYVVGGEAKNQGKFNQEILHFVNEAYRRYKPIGVATGASFYIQATEQNNLAGVIFAEDNPDFGEDFISAIAQQRFWNRT